MTHSDSIQKLEAKVAEFRSSEAARAGRSSVLQSLSLARPERELSYLHRIEDLELRLAKAVSSLQALETRIVVDVELLRRDVAAWGKASLSHGERPAMQEMQAPKAEAVESSDVELIVQDAMRVLSEPTTGPFVVIARPGRQLAHPGVVGPRLLHDSAMLVQIGVQTATEDPQGSAGEDLVPADADVGEKGNTTPKMEALVHTETAGEQQLGQEAKSEPVPPESQALCPQCRGHGKLGGGLCFECFGSGKASVDEHTSEIEKDVGERKSRPGTGCSRNKVSQVVPDVSGTSDALSKMEESGALQRLTERVANMERLLEENGIQKPVHASRKHWWS